MLKLWSELDKRRQSSAAREVWSRQPSFEATAYPARFDIPSQRDPREPSADDVDIETADASIGMAEHELWAASDVCHWASAQLQLPNTDVLTLAKSPPITGMQLETLSVADLKVRHRGGLVGMPSTPLPHAFT